MDNFEVKIVSENREHFIKALEICLLGRTVTHYLITKEMGLELYWGVTQPTNLTSLPYPMKDDVVIDFAWNWYRQADFGEFAGKEPNIDGSYAKGFSITAGHREWNHLARICPTWAYYGK